MRERASELSEEVSRPDLWDDADRARSVTTELGGLTDDITMLEDLAARLSDAEVLHELMVEEGDDSVASELSSSIDDLERRMGNLELRSLFSGEYDARDAIVELHAGTGGTDAQDWCEMLLRMYSRWAERRGFEAEIDETTEGKRPGSSLRR
jgi:peptide chain release factor 2